MSERVLIRLGGGTRAIHACGAPGVLAIFTWRLLNWRQPLFLEASLQRSDFVDVRDMRRACRLATECGAAIGHALNVGSGRSLSLRQVAEWLARPLSHTDLESALSGREGAVDIRHCSALLALVEQVLACRRRIGFDDGIVILVEGLAAQIVGRPYRARQLQPCSAWAGGIRPAASSFMARPGKARPVARPAIPNPRGRRRDRFALITGGAGFIGCNLANRLAADGEAVVVLDNLSRPGVDNNVVWLRERHGERVQIVLADVLDGRRLCDLLQCASVVFHLAAQVAVTASLRDPVHDFEVNARGTINVLEALRACETPPPLIFTSTNKVYGRLANLQVKEDHDLYRPRAEVVARFGIGEERPLDFCSPYGCSKGSADQYVLDYARVFGLPATVFRMSCIYGPHQFGTEDQGWIAHFMRRALERVPITIFGDGKQVRDVLFVDDLIEAFLLARRHIGLAAGAAFNIGGGPGNTVSLRQVLDRIAELDQQRAEVLYDDWRPGDQAYYVSDIRRFSRLTGWSPRIDVERGLRRLWQWLRTNILLERAARRSAL